MLSAASALFSRLALAEGVARRDALALSVVALLHVTALIIMVATEVDLIAKVAFLLTWALLNFVCLALMRRPIASGLISLTFIVALILLSQFKHEKLWMTVDFVDLMIIDRDTSAFLLAVIPGLRAQLAFAGFIVAMLLAIAWRLDPLRIRLRVSALGGTFCLAALTALALSFPTDLYEDFFGQNYVSKFARTGVEAMHELITHGYLDSNTAITEHLRASPVVGCVPTRRLPHIILLHDESSFDITAIPGVNVPSGYQNHFRSFDGKVRKLIVEGNGGPSWFTEYNVLTGLSARSYGRFARIARLACALRLQDLQPLPILRRFPELTGLPEDDWHRPLSRHDRSRYREFRARQLLLQPGRKDHRARARARAALPLRLHRCQPFPLGQPAAARADAELARSR